MGARKSQASGLSTPCTLGDGAATVTNLYQLGVLVCAVFCAVSPNALLTRISLVSDVDHGFDSDNLT